MNTVFSVDDSAYQQWQTEFLAWSFRESRQQGNLWRLLSSNKRKNDGFLYKSFVHAPYHLKDYPPYNKPLGIDLWLKASDLADEETLWVIDPDCVFTQPVYYQAIPEKPVCQKMGFMNPSHQDNKLILDRHCKSNRRLIRPVGVPYLITVGDMRKVSSRWLRITEDIRTDKVTLKASSWIAEMWGFAIALAEAGITSGLQDMQTLSNSKRMSAPLIHYSYASQCGTYKWYKREYKPWQDPGTPPNEIGKPSRLLLSMLRTFIDTKKGSPRKFQPNILRTGKVTGVYGGPGNVELATEDR